jgi:spermidine synthase
MTDTISPHWHIEFFAPDEAHMRGISKIYASEKTPYQKVEVIQSNHYGKCLILDGHMQSAQVDEFIYHENLVHPAMVTCPNPKKVVIIGGGEGATLYEVLRHKTVEKAWMIDIDKRVVELCDEYMPEWHRGAFKDKRTTLLFKDGRKFLEKSGPGLSSLYGRVLQDGIGEALGQRHGFTAVRLFGGEGASLPGGGAQYLEKGFPLGLFLARQCAVF